MSPVTTRQPLSQRVLNVPPSGIRRFFDIAATMKDVISLTIGEPDFTTPASISEAGIQAIREGQTKYTSNRGTVAIRDAIAAHLQRLYGVSYNPETEILATVGVSEAMLTAVMATIDPGDEVIVPEPCFVSYKATVAFAGGAPVTVATRAEDDFQAMAEDIEQAITPRTKALLIGFPSNPTGAVMTRANLLKIAELAEKHNLLVFSDEIYDQLVYGESHTCFASLPGMQERTILLGGFSKAYAMTGWRLGYVTAPKPILDGIFKVHQYAIMSAPSMAQAAGVEALANGAHHVEHMRQAYDARRRVVVDGLNTLGWPTFEPKGAFYAFPDVRSSGKSSEDVAQRLLEEQHVALVPGSAFGASGEGFLRLSYAASMESIEEALRRIAIFVGK